MLRNPSPIGRDWVLAVLGEPVGPPAGLPCLGTQLGTRVRAPRAVGLILRESAALSAPSTSLESEAAQVAAACPSWPALSPQARVATCGPPQLGRETDLSRAPWWIAFQEPVALCRKNWSRLEPGRPVSPAAPGSQAPLRSAPRWRSWRPGAGHTDLLLEPPQCSVSTSTGHSRWVTCSAD